MSIQKLTSIVRRGSMFAAVFAIVAATFAPAASTFADALNPLTERSLTLSSSSPGWDYKDGSGNSTYAPPNSGANGKKTGNTFAFKVSTTTTPSTMKAMTFQYCTASAGTCTDPGNITSGTNAANEAAHKSNLEVVSSSPSEIDSSSFATYVDGAMGGTGNIKAIPSASGTGNNFIVYSQSAGVGTVSQADDVWTYSPGWDMTTQVAQDGTPNAMPNQITLVNTGTGFAAGTPVKVVFFATDTNYITNPGQGAFFVKINTYSDVDVSTPATPVVDPNDIIDGGVTVANVMNQSIEIQTKVLETMDFSVGTVDPDTLTSGSGSQLFTANGNTKHTPCDRILTSMTPGDPDAAVNTLKMGDPTAEYSLATDKTYSTHSYWRLSSNSSAGATVYYSGNTLSNTVNDKIKAIGATKDAPTAGAEQFGLALANATDPPSGAPLTGYQVNYNAEDATGKPYEYGADSTAAGITELQAQLDAHIATPATPITASGIDSTVGTDVGANPSYHAPQLYPLKAADNYDQGAGVNNTDYAGTEAISTAYAFDETSQQIPVPLASENAQVVDCVTGKMRYIANIAATTPAGIYTTKINYIAAPQY